MVKYGKNKDYRNGEWVKPHSYFLSKGVVQQMSDKITYRTKHLPNIIDIESASLFEHLLSLKIKPEITETVCGEAIIIKDDKKGILFRVYKEIS